MTSKQRVFACLLLPCLIALAMIVGVWAGWSWDRNLGLEFHILYLAPAFYLAVLAVSQFGFVKLAANPPPAPDSTADCGDAKAPPPAPGAAPPEAPDPVRGLLGWCLACRCLPALSVLAIALLLSAVSAFPARTGLCGPVHGFPFVYLDGGGVVTGLPLIYVFIPSGKLANVAFYAVLTGVWLAFNRWLKRRRWIGARQASAAGLPVGGPGPAGTGRRWSATTPIPRVVLFLGLPLIAWLSVAAGAYAVAPETYWNGLLGVLLFGALYPLGWAFLGFLFGVRVTSRIIPALVCNDLLLAQPDVPGGSSKQRPTEGASSGEMSWVNGEQACKRWLWSPASAPKMVLILGLPLLALLSAVLGASPLTIGHHPNFFEWIGQLAGYPLHWALIGFAFGIPAGRPLTAPASPCS